MRWLNYHHLYYFWCVAKKGSVTEACRELRLAQPTISAQIHSLEDNLGEKLFLRDGRSLKLSEAGAVAMRYAEEIFGLGSELFDVIEGKLPQKPQELAIGVADMVPKLLAHKLISAAFELKDKPRIICTENSPDRLLAELSVHALDLVITDSPIPATAKVKAFNHYLGDCPVAFVGSSALVKRFAKGFPGSLAEAPLLLPSSGAVVRRNIDRWFEERSLTPNIVGEFQDSALMKTFAGAGSGIVPVPTAVLKEVCRDYRLKPLGALRDVRETIYLISLERKVKHPAVAVICEKAQRGILSGGKSRDN